MVNQALLTASALCVGKLEVMVRPQPHKMSLSVFLCEFTVIDGTIRHQTVLDQESMRSMTATSLQ